MRAINDANLNIQPEEKWGLARHTEDSISCSSCRPATPGDTWFIATCSATRREDIVDVVPDIGFHHRGAEKDGRKAIMAYLYSLYRPYRLSERVLNNLAYLLSVEKLAGLNPGPRQGDPHHDE